MEHPAHEKITGVNNFNFDVNGRNVLNDTNIFLWYKDEDEDDEPENEYEMINLGTKRGLITRKQRDNRIVGPYGKIYGTLAEPKIYNNLYIENPDVTKTVAEIIPHIFATEFTLSPREGEDKEPISVAYPVNGGKKSRRRKSRRNKSRRRKSRRRKHRK